MSKNKVLVGVDFSSHGAAALRFAHANAARLGWDLELVHSWTYPWWAVAPLGSAGEEARDEVISGARRHLAAFVDSHLPPDAEWSQLVVEGEAAKELAELAAADDVAAVVIGSTGRRAATALLSGAVGRRLVSAASTPVIIVPDDHEPGDGPIVVGVDSSTNSVRALEWACRHAGDRKVEVVTSWTSNAAHLAGVIAMDLDFLETSARKQLDTTLEKAMSDGIDVSGVSDRVMYGDPRIVLRDLSTTAEMLVVGAKGTSGLAGLLVGSVTSALLHHPQCPLVVVPGD